MVKALLGAQVDAGSLALLDEVRQLRQRVAELEAALERAEHAAAELTAAPREVVLEPTTA